MAIRHEDFLAKLPETERLAIAERAGELIREEASLRELREIRSRSQEEIARRLNVNQSAVSKLERRTDMYVSSLRDYLRAMGGDLVIMAKFPGQDPVQINQFRELTET
ncbi:MAG TPA: XRE family transcriptional regulator [Isosphaeraceae bacterium]|jgi:transcriptional regulator with XRE-family HTH domain